MKNAIKAAQRVHIRWMGIILMGMLPGVICAQITPFKALKQISAPDFMEVNFELEGNLIFLKGNADGVKGNFILDTGAPGLLLNNRYFAPTRIIFQFDALGVTGKVKEVGMRGIKSFHWEDLHAENMDAETMNFSHIEKARDRKILGLMGYQIFRGFELEIDYAAKVLRVYRLNATGKRKVKDRPRTEADLSASLQIGNHVPVVRARLGKKKLRFAVDTGAEINVLRPDLKPEILSHFSYEQKALLLGTGREQTKVNSGIMDTLYLHDRKWVEMKTVLAELGELSETYETRLDGVLGYEFFSKGVISINFKSKKLLFWFSKP